MEDDMIIEIVKRTALNSQIKAFNEGFEMGVELGKQCYGRKEK